MNAARMEMDFRSRAASVTGSLKVGGEGGGAPKHGGKSKIRYPVGGHHPVRV